MSTSTHPHPPADAGASIHEHRQEAGEREHQIRAFQAHAAVFAAGMVVIFLVNLLTNMAAGIAGEWSAWWSFWALIGWSLGIGVHGFVVWLARPDNNDAHEVGRTR